MSHKLYCAQQSIREFKSGLLKRSKNYLEENIGGEIKNKL